MAYGNPNIQEIYSPKLSFPLDSDPAYNSRIRFAAYSVEPINPGDYEGMGTGFMKTLKDNVGKLTNGGFTPITNMAMDAFDRLTGDGDNALAEAAKEAEEKKQKAINEEIAQTQTGFMSALSGYGIGPKIGPNIDMFVPLSITFGDNIQYETPNLGAAGAALGRSMEAGNPLLSSMFKATMEGVTTTTDVLLNGLGSIANQGGARLALQRAVNAASSAPGVPQGLGTAATIALQTSVNPNTRALFKGVQLREFSFNFQMIATSEKESEEIEKITNFFRDNMYPEVFDPFNQNIPFAYNFPNIFKIAFRIGNTKIKVPKIYECYLRNCQVIYNPTGAVYHKNGYANEIGMTLTFMEYKTLSKQDIKAGY